MGGTARKLAGVGALVVVAVTAAAGIGTGAEGGRQEPRGGAHATAAAPALTLPAPTGPYPVGTVALHLTDHHRPDPWVAQRPYRELMVSVRYPATRDAGRFPRVPQLTAVEAAAFDRLGNFADHVPAGKVAWGATLTHAHRGAPVARPDGRRLPVVLYSPGAGDPRSFGSALCDELASRGYAVVTLDHPYEAPAVEFPDGRVARSVMRAELAKAQRTGRITALLEKVAAVRVADARFVLDQLARGGADSALPTELRGALDPSAVGMFGQSAGGFTAVQTMHDDPRIRAAVNMDGVMGYTQRDDDPSHPSSVGLDGVDRPLMLMGMAGDDHHSIPSWGAAWRRSAARGTWLRDLTLRGGRHASFTDAQALIPQVARQVGLSRKDVTEMVGTLDPARAVAAERAYVTAFFDRWLRDRDGRLLDGPSARHPEVRFVP
ncbi:alpha/beta hydrolase family protein [Streptomyces sp. WZ-12]|uniref:alpha/beta hydrolase family protein n=1 Tax=Streptomyces sp. WZ-12 TaxID=3030210 RepID=UPI0023813D9F|nr:hydrolase [Streptomyces sp. WZ-12]